jgi:hypothetical protein
MADLERCELVDCDLEGADLTAARLPGSRIEGCTLDRAQLSKAAMAGTLLHGTTLEGVLGADALRGTTIGSDQVVALALPLFAALGITVDDGPAPSAGCDAVRMRCGTTHGARRAWAARANPVLIERPDPRVRRRAGAIGRPPLEALDHLR